LAAETVSLVKWQVGKASLPNKPHAAELLILHYLKVGLAAITWVNECIQANPQSANAERWGVVNKNRFWLQARWLVLEQSFLQQRNEAT